MGVTRRWLRRALWAGLAAWAVSAAAVLWLSDRMLDRHGDGREIAAPVDAAIVLGGGTDGDGVLAYSTRRRVASAVRALQQGRAERLILSGGLPWPGAPRSTAEKMRDYAVSLGAPETRLVVEPESRTTFENLRFSFALAEARGFARVAVASDAYHLARAELLADYLGRPDVPLIAAGGLAAEDYCAQVWAILREALAWWYNVYKVAAWQGMAALGMSEGERAAVVR